MRNKILVASALAATAMVFVAGCSSNQSLKTTDGKTIVTSGKPQVDDMIQAWYPTKMRKPVAWSRLIATR